MLNEINEEISKMSFLYLKDYNYFFSNDEFKNWGKGAINKSIKNLKEMIPITIWAFEGAKLGLKENIEEGWEGIDICNYHEFPFSDHMPICCNIGNIRVIAANNVSIMGIRGVNYNQDKFVENINLKYLQECSDKYLMPYFFELLRNMITSLIKTEAGSSILKKNVIDEFNKIIMIEEPWEQLKGLATLEIC